MENIIARAEVEIHARPADVWSALTDPEAIAQYFFGARVTTDWRPGSRITWRGEYEGIAYEDKGEVVEVESDRRLTVTHFSPMTGLPDEPQNYHTITFDLEERGDMTRVSLVQDNNRGRAEAERAMENWTVMLRGLKDIIERNG